MNGADPQDVTWVARMSDYTSSGVEQPSDRRVFLDVLHALAVKGLGHAEVARGLEPFPRVTTSVASGSGVVHQFPSSRECYLRRGDGSVPDEQVIEVPVMGEPAIFSGAFVLPIARAVELVEAFVRGALPSELGTWVRL